MTNSKQRSNSIVVVIGAQKSGTATLSQDMAKCVNFEVDLARKEESLLLRAGLNEKNNRDIEEFFTPSESGKVVVDVSTLYSTWPENPISVSSVKALFPDMKIVYLIREPVARSLSHHQQDVLTGRIKCDAERALEIDSPYIQNSLYGKQLSRWMKYVSIENVHVIKFETYISDRKRTLEDLCKFAGVAQDGIESIETSSAYNVTRNRPRFHPTIHRILESKLYHELVRKRVGSSFRNKLKHGFTLQNKTTKAQISEAKKLTLESLYKEDHKLLVEIYPDAPRWNKDAGQQDM